jgi:hypothetical protein
MLINVRTPAEGVEHTYVLLQTDAYSWLHGWVVIPHI